MPAVMHYIKEGSVRSVIWNIVLAPCLCLSYLLLLVPYLSAQVVQGKPSPAVVSVVVHAGQGTKNVPETLFGSFLEPIDDSVNNGLVAEILTNRSLDVRRIGEKGGRRLRVIAAPTEPAEPVRLAVLHITPVVGIVKIKIIPLDVRRHEMRRISHPVRATLRCNLFQRK